MSRSKNRGGVRLSLIGLLCLSVGINIYLLLPVLKSWSIPSLSSEELFEQVESGNNRRAFSTMAQTQGDDLNPENLQLLFAAEDFRTALLGYQLLQRQNPRQSQLLKQSWLKIVRGWLAQEGASYRVVDFTEAGLDTQPNDFDFRLLHAERYIASDNPEHVLRAIDIYYALYNESTQPLRGALISEIQKIVKNQVDMLSEQQAWQPLLRLAERLLWHEPMHPPYIFVYARTLIKLERYSLAKNSLLSIVYDEYYGGKAKQMLDEIALLDLSDQAVALQVDGAHYRVAGSINGRYPVSLMIDTGASLSVVSPRVLTQLNINPAPVFVRNATINTAGGKVNAPVFTVENFSIGDYSVPNMEFVLLDIDDAAAGAGLLGMNFLRNFVFKIDQKNNLLLLSAN